jgi:uncharacterized sporulation protein YeaH/YhbH (DUF444 family)
MTDLDSQEQAKARSGSRWYGLFSRGARDWLRHNEKVRDAVRSHLPDLAALPDSLGSSGSRTVRVPVRILEHYRFRLLDPPSQVGAGQGEAKPGDLLTPGRSSSRGRGEGAGGEGHGGLEFAVELKIDDIVDWLWEELELPSLEPKSGGSEEDELVREGFDRHGARARLDRRRTLREAIKRRATDRRGLDFANEDLRYRQLVRRPRPVTQAVVIFGLDASSSMADEDRRLAKTFFFWVLQGLRRQYRQIYAVFVAHTVEAWEFTEEEFFQVSAHGGTVASKAFNKALEILDERYSPARYNSYLFYASDGENFPEDRQAAEQALEALGAVLNFAGYVETAPRRQFALETEMGELFARQAERGLPMDSFALSDPDDVWGAIKRFFRRQAAQIG